MAITASLVKELRERTGAGMMDCKKALTETGGDIEAAVEVMRKAGQAKADKKAGRIAAEGVVMIQVSDDHKLAVMLEINCETDFVARDENFQTFANAIVQVALDQRIEDPAKLLEQPMPGNDGHSIEETRQNLIAKLGENMMLRRITFVSADGVVGAYRHGDRMAALVALNTADQELAKGLAMHIVAMKPQAISAEDVSQEYLDKEREIFTAQAKESGKPDEIIEKMIGGRIQKLLKEVSLTGQAYVKDPDTSVGDLLAKANATVTQFVRFEVGEGIEKKVDNFAEEVKAQVEGSN